MDVPFIEYNLDIDEEIEEARDKFRKYVELKMTTQEKECKNNGDNGDEDQGADGDGDVRNNVKQDSGIGKVTGYESDYLES